MRLQEGLRAYFGQSLLCLVLLDAVMNVSVIVPQASRIGDGENP